VEDPAAFVSLVRKVLAPLQSNCPAHCGVWTSGDCDCGVPELRALLGENDD
jgi:hypothetical protein